MEERTRGPVPAPLPCRDPEQSRPIPLHLLPDDVAAAIQAVESTDHAYGRTFRYRLANRVAAAEKLMSIWVS